MAHRNYVTYRDDTRGSSRTLVWWSLDVWFLRYACGQTNSHTDIQTRLSQQFAFSTKAKQSQEPVSLAIPSVKRAQDRSVSACVLSVSGRIYYIHVTALTHRARRTSSKRDQRLTPLARLASRQSYTPPALARTCHSPEISDHLSS